MPALLTEGCLKGHPFLSNCTSSFLNHLEEFATEKTFGPGEMILKEGDYSDRFYLICEGRVLVEHSDGRHPAIVVQELGPGDTLGWSWILPPYVWHFNARALESCEVVELNAASLLVRAEEDPEFGYELMKRVSLQLLQRLQAVRRRLTEELRRKSLPRNADHLAVRQKYGSVLAPRDVSA
jgi:CRP-like cAMP-binding protein